MSEEVEEAIKLFDREDLLSDYGIQDTDTNIEVFLSVKDMIKYYKQGKEIKRLKEEYVMLQNASDEVEEELQQRIDKAIEHIEKVKDMYTINEVVNQVGIPILDISIEIWKKKLLDILKGSDKE